jgi:hypothetical protein
MNQTSTNLVEKYSKKQISFENDANSWNNGIKMVMKAN